MIASYISLLGRGTIIRDMSIFGGSSTEESDGENNEEPEERAEEEVEEETGETAEEEPEELEEPEDEEPEEESEDGVDGVLEEGDGESEVVETEAVVVDDAPEEPEDLPVAEVDSTELATYSASFGGFSFQLLPQSTSSGVDWRVWVFANNVQGPILRTDTGISEEEAEDLGIPESLRIRINEGLEFAREELGLPDSLRRATEDRSLEDLEMLMEERG